MKNFFVSFPVLFLSIYSVSNGFDSDADVQCLGGLHISDCLLSQAITKYYKGNSMISSNYIISWSCYLSLWIKDKKVELP